DKILMLIVAEQASTATALQSAGNDERRSPAAQFHHVAGLALFNCADEAPQKGRIRLPTAKIGQRVLRQIKMREQSLFVSLRTTPKAAQQPWPLDRAPGDGKKTLCKWAVWRGAR